MHSYDNRPRSTLYLRTLYFVHLSMLEAEPPCNHTATQQDQEDQKSRKLDPCLSPAVGSTISSDKQSSVYSITTILEQTNLQKKRGRGFLIIAFIMRHR